MNQNQSKNTNWYFTGIVSLDDCRLVHKSYFPRFSFVLSSESTVFFPEQIHSVQEDVGELFIPVHRSGDISEELMVVCYTQQGMNLPLFFLFCHLTATNDSLGGESHYVSLD